jgi:hypothetical protein
VFGGKDRAVLANARNRKKMQNAALSALTQKPHTEERSAHERVPKDKHSFQRHANVYQY